MGKDQNLHSEVDKLLYRNSEKCVCIAYNTIFHIETEKVIYSSPQDEQMMEVLGDEVARHAFDEKSYSNTKLYAYNMESGENVLLGNYAMHTIHTLQLYGDKLYLKGILATITFFRKILVHT